jgi:hypothetical protein
MTNLKTAVASVAWRNNGTKAPITVMFVQDKERTAMNIHSRLVSRGLGVSNSTKQTLLYNYTEDVFNEDFSEFGFTAEDITNGYRDENGNISAHEINLTSEKIFGEPVYISRYETTNTLEATNENGDLKTGWSIKTVNGQELTNEGALIYSTFIFSEDGKDHKIQHDQDLRKVKSVEGISENSNVESKVESTTTESAPF